MKKKSLKLFWELFRATFTLSAFTFGGGYIIVSLMKKDFVEKKHWLENDEMLDLTALAQETLGTIHAVDGEETLYTWTGFGKIHSLTREVTGGGLAVIMILKEE